MDQSEQEAFLSVDEAIALLGIKRATLYAYVSRGVLRSYRQAVGRQRLYRRAEVEALLTVRADTPSPQVAARSANPAPAAYPSAPEATPDDRTMREVSLPYAETWAGDH